jgi:hypothetical protein
MIVNGRLSQSFGKADVDTEAIDLYMNEEYVKWCDKAVSNRLYKPVDPDHISISGAKAATFMGFFESVVHKLALYERKTNPPSKLELKSSDKDDDEELMRKTADYNDNDIDSPKQKTVRIQSTAKDDEKDYGIESTSRHQRQSSGDKIAKIKKMTDEV